MIDLILGTSMFAGAILVVCILAVMGQRGLGGLLLNNETATSFFVVVAVASASLGLTFVWVGLNILSVTVVTKSIIIFLSIVVAIVFCTAFLKVANRNNETEKPHKKA
jgi:hypothetical protein